MKMPKTTPEGQIWAYFFLVLGLSVSLGANYASVHVAPPGIPQKGYEPGFIRITMALAAPLALWGAIEVVARNPWPRTWYWQVQRWGFAAAVGGWAGTISYLHFYHLLMHNLHARTGTHPPEAVGTALMIDGLILLCTSALLIPHGEPEPEPGSDLALRPVRVKTQWLPVFVDREVEVVKEVPVEKVVEKIVYRERPPQPQQQPGQRIRPEQHPLWSAFTSAVPPWDEQRMLKELRNLDPNTTPAAARSRLQRWQRRAVELSTSG